MTYSAFDIDQKQMAVALLMSDMAKEIHRHFSRMAEEEGMTQQDLADKLNVDKSRISKMMSGFNNLTFKSFAELCWAMNAEPVLKIECSQDAADIDEARVTSIAARPIQGSDYVAPLHSASVTRDKPPVRTPSADADHQFFGGRFIHVPATPRYEFADVFYELASETAAAREASAPSTSTKPFEDCTQENVQYSMEGA